MVVVKMAITPLQLVISMRQQSFLVLLTSFCLASSAGAAESNSYLAACDELRKAWVDIDQLPVSENTKLAQKGIQKALASLYLAQGKDCKAFWLQCATVDKISESIRQQRNGEQKDFPEAYGLFYRIVTKEPNGTLKFRWRGGHNAHYAIVSRESASHADCMKLLKSIPADGEAHGIPNDFPFEKLVLSDQKYSGGSYIPQHPVGPQPINPWPGKSH